MVIFERRNKKEGRSALGHPRKIARRQEKDTGNPALLLKVIDAQ